MNQKYYQQLIEENQVEFLFTLGQDEKYSHYDSTKMKWIFTGIPNLNCIFNTRLDEKQINSEIFSIVNQAQFKNSSLTWLVNDSTQPVNMDQYLLDSGFKYKKKISGMACSLDKKRWQPPPVDQKISIRQISEKADFDQWFEIISRIFQYHDSYREKTYQLFFNRLLKNDHHFSLFTAYENDEPASTGALFKGSRSAGIYYIATVPQKRGHGIAAALIDVLFKKAGSIGYKDLVLLSSRQGLNLYKKFGFREFYEEKLYVYQNSKT